MEIHLKIILLKCTIGMFRNIKNHIIHQIGYCYKVGLVFIDLLY